MAERYPHVNKANQYCRDVVSGKIDACLYARQACQRHLDNLESSKSKSYRWIFDKDKAERACVFIELMKHVKGQWAGNRFILEPWQCFIVTSLIGWIARADGMRRFREGFIFVPRKNGKTLLAAGIGGYMFMADKEPGAEIYCAATSEAQAWEVFRPAKQIISGSRFEKKFGVTVNAKSMTTTAGSRFLPIIGRPRDGASPHLGIMDEYHEAATSELFDALQTGMGARTQPMMFTISTAGTNRPGPCGTYFDQCVKILAGTIQNDRVFAIMYGLDEDDDWTDLKSWKKANPNYGVSVNDEYLIHQLETAKQNPSKQNIIRCKHLNQWLSVDTAWMDMLKLAKCKDLSLIPESMTGKRCVLALDLASKIDIAALNILFFDDKEYWTFGRYYSCRATVDKPENQHYQTWELEERLIVHPGERIDFGAIEEDVKDFCKQFQVDGIAYDPFQAVQLAANLTAEGLLMIETRATVQNFSEPMKLLEAAIYSGEFHYDGCPLLTWMFSNVVAHYDKKENIYPNKTRNENKIDGVVALIMSMNAATRLKSTPKEPEPGIIVI